MSRHRPWATIANGLYASLSNLQPHPAQMTTADSAGREEPRERRHACMCPQATYNNRVRLRRPVCNHCCLPSFTHHQWHGVRI